MGHLGKRNNDDAIFQTGDRLKVGTPESLSVEILTVLSGATLPAFDSLSVNPTGTSRLATVTQGTWNAALIAEAYGGTNRSSYNQGEILYASAANTLSVLPSGSEGQLLQVSLGSLSWEDPVVAPAASGSLPVVLIGTAATINPGNDDKYIMVSGVALVTVNLPASPSVGQEHFVKDRQGIAASSGITLSGNGNLIDGASSTSLVNNYESIGIVWDGAQWSII